MDSKKLKDFKEKLTREKNEAYEKNIKMKKEKKEAKKIAKSAVLSQPSTSREEPKQYQIYECEITPEKKPARNQKQPKTTKYVMSSPSHSTSDESDKKFVDHEPKPKDKTVEKKNIHSLYPQNNGNNQIQEVDENIKKTQKFKGKTKKPTPSKKNKDNINREKVRKRVQKHKKHRAKLTEDQLNEKRRKDRERYQKEKEQGLAKSIKDRTPKDQKSLRKRWKKNSKRYRDKLKLQTRTEEILKENSPPTSEDESMDIQQNQEVYQKDDFDLMNKLKKKKISSRQKSVGRQRIKKDKASCYRKLKKAQEKIQILNKMLNKSRKRLEREKRRNNTKSDNIIADIDSPATKVTKMIAGIEVPPSVKKSLLLGEVIKDQLEQNSKKAVGHNDKNLLKKFVSGKIIKKYRLVGQTKKILSYKMHQKSNESQYDRKKRNHEIIQKVAKSVQDFFEKDENSKMCPGKKDFVTKNKIKKQKRILLDTLANLHKKYLANEDTYKISQTTFCRFKPFWVVIPKQSDRDTCACSKHSNIEMLCTSLYNAKVTTILKPDELLKAVVCDDKNIECMLRNCPECKGKFIPLRAKGEELTKKILYRQWESKTENKEIKGEVKSIRKTVKIEKNDTAKNIINLLQGQLTQYMKHVFFMRHQQREMQRLKQFLQPNELLIQIDFSENYVAKYESEIQSMHFGASKKQISLHTGIYYYRVENDSPVNSQCFCSVSDNLDHQSHAVWAHLDGILKELAICFPNITKIHFLSDGPTSQYKNRNNCFMMMKKIPQYFKNVESLSWNFSESGHGKGPMDGVGGVLKRTADKFVLHGNDIVCAGDFVRELGKSSVKIWEVSDDEIRAAKLEIPSNISQVPNIMATHQVTWSKKSANQLFLRSLSCFTCKFEEPCIHYSVKPSVVTMTVKNKNIAKEREPDFESSMPGTSNSVDLSSELRSVAKTVATSSKIKLVGVAGQPFTSVKESTYPTFEKNIKVTLGLCYTCTRNLNVQNEGRKCQGCIRTYHS